MKKLFILLLIVIFISFNAHAVQYYDDGLEHDISTPVNDGIEIYNGDVHMGPPTTVNVQSGGSIYGADIYDQSILNVYAGGEVGDILSHHESHFNVFDGIVHYIDLDALSSGTMSGGTVTQVDVTQESHFSVSGGEITGDMAMPGIVTSDYATAEISGGYVGEVFSLGNSTVEMSDGIVQRMTVVENGTANVTGGRIDELWLYENSQLEMTNVFMDPIGPGGITINDYSHVSISGGNVRFVSNGNSTVEVTNAILSFGIEDNGQVTVTDSEIEHLPSELRMNSSLSLTNTYIDYVHPIDIYDTSHLTVSMDTYLDEIGLYNNSRLTLSGGGALSVDAFNDSFVEISEGWICELAALGNSIVEITGGDIESLLADSSSFVVINGLNFNYGYGYITDTSGFLTGMLLSGDIIDMSFERFGDAQILIVPEPATLLLLSLGGLVMRRRGK